MARKEKLKVNRVDLDNDLEIPDFDFDLPPPKDDRKPVTKFAAGAISGAKSALFSSEFIKGAIKKSLPDGYGMAIDLADSVNTETKKLYNNAVNQIKPSVNEMARAGSKLVPGQKVKTKAALDSVAKWSQNNASKYSSDSKDQQREAGMSLAMADVFKFQAEQTIKSNAEQDIKDKIQTSLEISRHKDTFGLLNNINLGVSRLSQYQEKITAAYQKKSLELQYRGYFVAMDALEESKKQNEIVKTALLNITKNTALPESVKVTAHDSFKDVARNKFWSSVNEGLFGGRNNIVGKISNKLGETLRDKLNSVSEAFSMAAMGMEQMQAAAEMGESMGMPLQSKSEMAGNIAGSMTLNEIATRAGAKTKSILDKNKKIGSIGRQLENGVGNLPQHLTELRKSNRGDWDSVDDKTITKVGNFFLRAFKSIIPDMGANTTVESDKVQKLTDPFIYTKQTHKSINEVIPGFLSRIFRELQVLRTGNTNIGLSTYDFNKNKFSTVKEADQNIFSQIINTDKSGKSYTKAQLDELISELDPKGKLDSAARSALSKKLLSDNMDTRSGSASRLVNTGSYNTEETKKYAVLFSEIFKEYFKTDSSGNLLDKDNLEDLDKGMKFNRKYKQLGTSMADSRGMIQQMINLGQTDFLKSIGLVNEDLTKIDLQRLQDLHMGANFNLKTDKVIPGKKALEIIRNTTSNDPSDLRTMSSISVSAIKEMDRKQSEEVSPLVDIGLATLTKLEEIRILIKNKSFGDSSNGSGNTNSKQDEPSTGFFNSLKAFTRSGIKLGREGFRKGSSLGRGILNTATKSINPVIQLFGSTKDFVLDKLRNGVKIKDLFISGETEPRLTAVKMRAGKYFTKLKDGTLKVVQTIDDVTDTIYDEAGNVILSRDELGKLFSKSIDGKGFVKFTTNAIKRVFSLGNNLAKTGLNLIPPIVRMAGSILAGIKNKIIDFLDEPVDIYISGSSVPVMIARIMKTGGYFSQRTKKAILRPSDIDGTVLNSEGNVVLTEEELKSGIFDKLGNPIKTPFEKIKGFVTGTISKTLGLMKNTGNKILDLAKGGLDGAKNLIKNGLNIGVGFKENNNILMQIRDILDSRLPGKKSRFNDKDGDGNREGSWRTMGKKAKGKASDIKDTLKNGVSGEKKPNFVSKMLNKLFGIKDQEQIAEDSLDELTDIKHILMAQAAGDAIPDLGGNSGKTTKGGKPSGRLARMGGKLRGFGSGLARIGGKILPGAGLALGAAGAYANIKDGNYGAAAMDAGLGLGGFALAGGSLSGLTGSAAAVGGSIAAGAGALLASPVVLGALAVGAVGAAGYYGYKYLTKNNASSLELVRYVQYGFKADNKEFISKVFNLESLLAEKNIIYENGIARLTDKNFDIQKALDIFSIDKNDTESYNNWISWFTGRFKPVYLTHLTGLFSVNSKIQLSEINNLKPEQKVKYLKLVSFSEGPYNVDYPASPELNGTVSDANDVKNIIALANKDLEKDRSKTLSSISGTQLAVTGALSNKSTVSVNESLNSKEAVIDSALKQENGIFSKFKDLGKAIATPLMVTGSIIGRFLGYNTTSLETVRFKAYGLKTLERSKVVSLRNLEEHVFKDVKYDSTGTASWSSTAEIIIRYVGKDFGVESTTSTQANDWMTWFIKRFLPIYLSYLGLMKQATGKENPSSGEKALKTSQQFSIATKISATPNIWSITNSPWEGYKLLTDINELKDNLALLKETSEKDELIEAKAKQQAKSSVSNQNTNSEIANKTLDIPKKQLPVPSPDSESKPIDVQGGTSTISGQSSSSTPKLAGGAIFDGRNASAFMKLGPGVSLNGLNAEMLKNFNGMVEEYGAMTGNTTYVTSGVRTFEQQNALYKKDPKKAAKPGGSLHEFGLALDVSSSTLDDLDNLGLMKKYGFTRPIGGETWHLESAGIQQNKDAAKNDPNYASKAIMASLGRGGGGFGSIKGTPMGKRNPELAKQLFEAGGTPMASAGAIDSLPQPIQTKDSNKPTITPGGSVIASSKTENNQSNPKEISRGYSSSTTKPTINSPDTESSKVFDFKDVVSTKGGLGNIPDVKGGSGLSSVRATIEAAAKIVGVDSDLMLGVAGMESSFNPNAKADSSSASGLYQFTKGTWAEMLSKYGAKYGLDANTSPFDAKANALMGGEYLKANMKSIASSKPNPNSTDLYMAHFLGGSGARKLFASDPNTSAAQLMPQAAAANKSVFYNGNTPRTAGEIYSLMDSKVNKTLNGLGLNVKGTGIGLKANGSIGMKASIGSNSLPSLPNTTSVPLGESLSSNESIVKPTDNNENKIPTRSFSATLTPAISGFGSMGSSQTNQPQQDTRYDMNAAMGGVSDTLKQSLTVQTQIYGVLKDILTGINPKTLINAMQSTKTDEKSLDSTNGNSASTKSDVDRFGTRNIKSVPVSMSRTMV